MTALMKCWRRLESCTDLAAFCNEERRRLGLAKGTPDSARLQHIRTKPSGTVKLIAPDPRYRKRRQPNEAHPRH
jgi:hypothetical protein